MFRQRSHFEACKRSAACSLTNFGIWAPSIPQTPRSLTRTASAIASVPTLAGFRKQCRPCGFLRLRRSSHQREQPPPTHRARPAPDMPGRLAVADRKEDDLGLTDKVLEWNVTDGRRHAAV